MKDVQATGEAFSPQKISTSNSKYEFSQLFIFVGHFCLPLSGSAFCMRIRIQQLKKCGSGTLFQNVYRIKLFYFCRSRNVP
jgi:hypothetical protein